VRIIDDEDEFNRDARTGPGGGAATGRSGREVKPGQSRRERDVLPREERTLE
jgi:hypothetical protein